MRSEHWLDTRPERVEQKLLKALEAGGIDVGVLLSAFREVTDYTANEHDARIVAQGLGVLPGTRFDDPTCVSVTPKDKPGHRCSARISARRPIAEC
jgi:hypothetical protein